MTLRKLTSPHVKTRRVSYLRQIVNILGARPLSDKLLISKVEDWATRNKKLLEEYIDCTGELTKGKKPWVHNAARRYTALCSELKLIGKAKEYRSWMATKYGRTLSELKMNHSNPFFLSLEEICGFLRRIFIEDADAFLTLLPLVSKGDFENIEQLKNLYYKIFKNRLELKMKFSKGEEKINLKKEIDRIQRWTNPKKYLDNIVPPRIHWLLDLRLLDWKIYHDKSDFVLSPSGMNLLQFLRESGVGSEELLDVNEDWLQNKYFDAFNHAFQKEFLRKHWSELPDDTQMQVLIPYLDEAIDLFAFGPIPRVIFSQFLEYFAVKLAVRKGITCGLEDLKTTLSGEMLSRSQFQFTWVTASNDGYIIKKT